MFVTEGRYKRIEEVASMRQEGFTAIIENVHDPHNLGAILRTCDSVGIREVFALYTIESPDKLKVLAGNKTSSGAKKWVDIHVFEDTLECVEVVRRKYDVILGTHLGVDSISLYDVDFHSRSIAVVFGNEHRGISEELLSLLDGNFLIPQVGMTQSLNISVACAVSLYEGMRQRLNAGKYDAEKIASSDFGKDCLNQYLEKSRPLSKNN